MTTSRRTRTLLDRALDPLVAAFFGITWTIELINMKHLTGPLWLNVVFAVAITIQIVWRRRAPFAFVVVIMALSVAMTATVTNLTGNWAPIYILFIPPYTVAAYESDRLARAGLGICIGADLTVAAIAGGHVSDYVFITALPLASWAAGRALRARRLLADELRRKADRIAAERDGRIQLAIADERTRIARELHALVAGSVSAMVVQTEAAERMLDDDLDAADEAMAAVEETGREALAEMRRILGVLRRGEGTAELEPQPGVGQVHSLVERVRSAGVQVTMSIEGEPGPLPASVDLGLYRVLEEALSPGDSDASVVVRFGDHEVDLSVTADGPGVLAWPTLAMRERVAMCSGEIEVAPVIGGPGRRLAVRMPRVFEEVFV